MADGSMEVDGNGATPPNGEAPPETEAEPERKYYRLSKKDNTIAFSNEDIRINVATSASCVGIDMPENFPGVTAKGAKGPWIITTTPEEHAFSIEEGEKLIITEANSVTFTVQECDEDGNLPRTITPQARAQRQQAAQERTRTYLQAKAAKDLHTITLYFNLPPKLNTASYAKGQLNGALQEVRKAIDSLCAGKVAIQSLTFNQPTDKHGYLVSCINAYLALAEPPTSPNVRNLSWTSLKYISLGHGRFPIITRVKAAQMEDLELRPCCLRPLSVCEGHSTNGQGQICPIRELRLREIGYVDSTQPARGTGQNRIEREQSKKARLDAIVNRKLQDRDAAMQATQQAMLAGLCADFKKGKVCKITPRALLTYMTLTCMLAVCDCGMQRDPWEPPPLAIHYRLHQHTGCYQALHVHRTGLPLQRARPCLMAGKGRTPPRTRRVEEHETMRKSRQGVLLQSKCMPGSGHRIHPRTDERVQTGPDIPMHGLRILYSAERGDKEGKSHAKGRDQGNRWMCIRTVHGQPISLPDKCIHKNTNCAHTGDKGRDQHNRPPPSHYPGPRTFGLRVGKSMQESTRHGKTRARQTPHWHSSNILYLTNRLSWMAEGSGGSYA